MLGAGCVSPTDFQRSALLVGLAEELEIGLNPIKLGIIASTDTHTATPGAVVESNWQGAISGEATPAERLEPGLLTSGIDGNPGGLAGVWAKENTRAEIFAAMLRREVFGTSGPRITPRLFAGWDYPQNLCDDPDLVEAAYAGGVPMGGDLPAAINPNAAPKFLALAAQDPAGQGLADLHLVKGWVDAQGHKHNKVVNVAHASPAASSLCAVYTDPEFIPGESSYYYLRAVESPTPRWHTYDCERIPQGQRPQVCTDGSYPETVREMAWTSPIWVQL